MEDVKRVASVATGQYRREQIGGKLGMGVGVGE